MANVKITDYLELITPAGDDLLEIVDDVAVLPTSKKITVANLFASPSAIGGATPAAGAFTTLSATGPITAAGGQVAFPATAVPSSDPNTLDDYEEGTATAGITFGGGNVGVLYASNTWYYTKIGDIVFFTGNLVLTSKGTSLGGVKLTGLPFISIASADSYGSISVRPENITFADVFLAYVIINSTDLSMAEVTTLGVVSGLTDADFSDTSGVAITGVYKIA